MTNNQTEQHVHPVVFAIRSILRKFVQSPDFYPIKHYTKAAKSRRKTADMYK